MLGLPVDREAALAALNAAVAGAREVLRVRLTLDEAGAFACTAAPLGAASAHWSYAVSPHPVQSGDLLLRHKTTWRSFHDDEQARLARANGCDETVCVNARGQVTEGSRSNVFVRRR